MDNYKVFFGIAGVVFLLVMFKMASLPNNINRYYIPSFFAGLKTGVDPDLILAMIQVESNGIPDAMGSAGEVGLMQVQQVAINHLVDEGYSVHPEQTTDVYKNIVQGASYYSMMADSTLNEFNALRAYNAGLAGSRKNPVAGNEYAKKVLRLYNEFR